MPTLIPQRQGVPGKNSAPQWWAPAAPDYDRSLHDPRWTGAVRRGYSTGTGEYAAFRAVSERVAGGPPVLFLSFQVFDDPSAGPNADGVVIGLQSPSGAAHLIEVLAYSSIASVEAAAPASISFSQLTPTSATHASTVSRPVPAWLSTTRAWLSVVPTGGGGSRYNWAVNLRIPTRAAGGPDVDDSGIVLGDPFRLWYAVVTDLGPTVAPAYWPREGARIVGTDTGDFYPLPVSTGGTAQWDEVRTTGAGGTGITLNGADIGTTNPSPTTINVSTTGPTVNRLFARPLNGTGAAIAPRSLRARFRTANWGSQANFSTAAGATAWEEVLPDVVKDNGPTSTPAGGRPSIEFDWTISAAEAADWVPPAGRKWTHQCMLVTLEGPYDFVQDSAYRNMDFVKASEFQRQAEINIEGATPGRGRAPAVQLPGRGRFGVFGRFDSRDLLERWRPATAKHVYVAVERSNMPVSPRLPERPRNPRVVLREVQQRGVPSVRAAAAGTEGERFDAVAAFEPLRLAAEPSVSDVRFGTALRPEIGPGRLRGRVLDVLLRRQPPVVFGRPPGGFRPGPPALDRIRLESLVDRTDFDVVAAFSPTIRYRVFRPTGETITVGGVVKPVVAEQTSFGYAVEHDGDVYGWDQSLKGDFTKEGDGLFRLKVSGGKAVIGTSLRAWESPPPARRQPEVDRGPRVPVVGVPVPGRVRESLAEVLRRRGSGRQ